MKVCLKLEVEGGQERDDWSLQWGILKVGMTTNDRSRKNALAKEAKPTQYYNVKVTGRRKER